MALIAQTTFTAPIPGVEVRRLEPHADERGTFIEIFRECWTGAPKFIQWNAVTSRAGTLRGVHVHRRHADYLVVLAGRMTLGLADLRPNFEEGRAILEMEATQPIAVTIPIGVAHGFLFAADSLHVYGVSQYFDPTDELGCRWDDPALGLPWPIRPSYLSARDESLPSLETLRATLAREA